MNSFFNIRWSISSSSFQMVDEVTKKTLSNIPLLKTKASPRDGEQWRQRLKEELQALIQVKRISSQQKKLSLSICGSF